ncbi:MAG: SRPBCC domain-containing protein [Acidimicrobiia bacterium]|nr:SRPBCC domain-containing protein [Acidimicrobiia bacterium]
MTDTTSPTSPPTALGELTIVRTHAAPPELLFDCMTTPAHLARFWGPKGSTTPVGNITVDLRPGGAFETVMVSDDDGTEYSMHALYVTIERPTRLVFTERDVEGGLTTTVTFRDLGDGRTEVTTHQTNVPTEYLTPENRAGFESSLDRFDDYVAELGAAGS